MNKAYVKLDATRCTGCSACMNACPQACITMAADAQGFLIPKVEEDSCISCGICKMNCPELQPVQCNRSAAPQAYAAQASDVGTRFCSTSGGVFSELAFQIIDQGGYVAGAIYGERQKIRHFITNNREDIKRLRQSKYAQSDKGDVFTQVRRLLGDGKTVLFAGAPCEIAGLLAYLGQHPQSLILVDYICLGANSPLVYEKYLGYLEKRCHSKIKRVWFKYKKFGWEQFATRVDFENGHTYVRDRYSDLYMRGYIQKSLYLRPCCRHCQYKGFPRCSDITLGDFWGVGRVFPNIDKAYGVSAVCVNTDIGRKMLRSISDRLILQECGIDDISAGNVNLTSSASEEERCETFYEDLERLGFEKAVKMRVKESFVVSLKKRLKCCWRTWKQRKSLTFRIKGE